MDFDYRGAEDVVFLRTGSEKQPDTALKVMHIPGT